MCKSARRNSASPRVFKADIVCVRENGARGIDGESISARDARRMLVFRLRDAAAPLFGKYKRAGRWRWFNERQEGGDDPKECGLHYNI